MRLGHWGGLTALAVTLMLTACGGDGGAGTTTTTARAEITITATEFQFDRDPILVPAGTELTITVVNSGVVEHDVSIDELNLKILARPGESVSETITIPAGTYMLYCSVPGHHEAGMMAELIASE